MHAMEETNKLNHVPLGQSPIGYVYRDQTRRYPWWVKSVERITAPIGDSAWSRKVTTLFQTRLLEEPEIAKAKPELMVEKIANHIRKGLPGNQLKDLALHYTSTSFSAAGVSKFEGNFITHFLSIGIRKPMKRLLKREIIIFQKYQKLKRALGKKQASSIRE